MPTQPGVPGTTPSPTDPSAGAQPAVQPPSDAFAQASQTPEAGPGDSPSFTPNMQGDLIGFIGGQIITGPQGTTRIVRVPINSAGAYKIAENESPRPTDRAFLTYNYYNDVLGSLNPGFPALGFHRQVAGFEKTLLDGNASVGLRLPFFQLTGQSDVDDSGIGDLTVITKYAFINDRCTGDVLSAGLCITVPTGEDNVDLIGGILNTTYLQPWGGFIVNMNRDWFVQGFSAVLVPLDDEFVTLLMNDIAIGYWLRRDNRCGLINSIVPMIECHVTNPLNHRGSDNLPVGFPDVVNMTYGVNLRSNFGWGVTAGVGHPLTGPKLFDFECLVQVNYQF
jgi:hypothetical protein